MDYTTDGLIEKIKRSFAASDNDPNFSPSNVVAYLNDELIGTVVPLISKLSEEYFVTYQDTLIQGTVDTYDIPRDALVSGLQDVNIIKPDSSGLETKAEVTQIAHIQPDMMNYHTAGYFLRDNELVLLNPNNYNGRYLRYYYSRRPYELVVTTDARQVVNVSGSTLSLTSMPSAWTSSTLYSVIQGKPPFNVLAASAPATVSGTDLIFATAPAGVVVGDWVALAHQSPIAQIPYETFPLLAQAVTVRMCEALDRQALPMAAARYKQLQDNIQTILVNRVQADPVRLVRKDSFLNYL